MYLNMFPKNIFTKTILGKNYARTGIPLFEMVLVTLRSWHEEQKHSACKVLFQQIPNF